MLRLKCIISLTSDTKSFIPLLKNAMASALFIVSFTTLPAVASNQTFIPISRAEAANPSNFKHLNMNGRAAAYASAPCSIEKGLINCGFEKLKIINSGIDEVEADYDLAQAFYYPSKAQPRTAVVVITRAGLMDDSVSAERYRISFELEEKQSNLNWNWVQYGIQYQCIRGNKAGKWSKNLCL